MASVRPFAALRPSGEMAGRLCVPPYDVVSAAEGRALVAGNPSSFLRVTRPEVEAPPGTDGCAAAVYERGRDNLGRFIAEGWLRRDAGPGYYLYRQSGGDHSQVGLVGLASCEEYLQGRICRHELTRPDKEEDRFRHIDVLGAETGPAFLFFRAEAWFREWVARETAGDPEVEFTASDGVRHSSWAVRDPARVTEVEARVRGIERLYVADGHHRSAAAARVYRKRRGEGGSGGLLAVLFPHDTLRILPYHRVLKDLHGQSPVTVRERLAAAYRVEPAAAVGVPRRHELYLVLGPEIHRLALREALRPPEATVEGLDVALLQEHVLGPIFGVQDPRTSARLEFVGGPGGAAEVERGVRRGEYACGFVLPATRIEDLMRLADAGQLLPPKSTWFEPKLRDGMFTHLL